MVEGWKAEELEGFEALRLERSLPLLRVFLAVAALGTPLFGFWDRFVDPGVPIQAFYLRLGFGAVAGGLLALSYVRRLRAWLFLLMPLTQWLGVMAVSILLSWLELGFLYGLPGLLLTGMAMTAFAPLWRIYVLSCLACLVLPNLVMAYAGVPAKLMLNANVFLVSMFGLQLVFGWFLQRLSRQEYVLERRLEHQATRDGLTQLYNRRQFLSLMEAEFSRSRRYGQPLSFAMLDLDHFKAINDRHGHAVGDWVLVHFAECGRNVLREQDYFGRLGGEEFGVLLVHADQAQALEALERLRRAVEEAVLPSARGELRYTVSMGLAELSEADADVPALLRRADGALYQAKSQGRNRVVVAD
ncbi:MAG: GGDEF domain-containing protein [Gammaproteobacteria bacterium]|nr:GGDEF domain-containing protein [Gammaproteobacteria bacterium]